jgi:spore coat assembly protein SafA
MSTMTVQSGDSLSAIADRYSVSLDALEQANPQLDDPNLIYPGQVLNVPDGFDDSPAPAPVDLGNAPSSSGLSSYMVQPGDSMSGIADSLGVSLDALEAANPDVSDPNLIYPGQQLNVPGGDGSAPSAPTSSPAPAPAPSHGNAADVARQFLGESEYQLQPSGALDMDQWVPKDVDCANFVSGCLEAAGAIDPSQRSDAVTTLAGNLRNAGWQDVSLSDAQPGDVVCFDGPDGAYQHVELFAGWNGGQPQFIGSNNVNADGTQSITYDNGSWAYGFHVLHQP